MSRDKHRNAEDRQLVLDSLSEPGGAHLARKELERRRCRIDKRFERWFWGAPKFDSLGRGPWALYWHHMKHLVKMGLVKTHRTTWGSLKVTRHTKFKPKRITVIGGRTNYQPVSDPLKPGKARNERRGQSKPGFHR